MTLTQRQTPSEDKYNRLEDLENHPILSVVPQILNIPLGRSISKEQLNETLQYLDNPVIVEQEYHYPDGTVSTGNWRYALSYNTISLGNQGFSISMESIDSSASVSLSILDIANETPLSTEAEGTTVAYKAIGRLNDLESLNQSPSKKSKEEILSYDRKKIEAKLSGEA
jgi:hypothetical protein